MKKAICVGINNYPGSVNDLNGCINDANDWSALLVNFGFETRKILDAEATKDNILDAFNNLISEATAGDVVVFTYSGHGTQVLDTSHDEADSYDEALYVYDNVIIDDDLREILQNADKDAQIVIIADSCFSGTVTKALLPETVKPRFIRTDEIPATAKLKKSFLSKLPDEDMVEILLSGCSDSEYSYDANINGKWNGAMTANAIPLIQPNLTYNELYAKIREKLPSAEFPQTPQLEGSTENMNRQIFTPKPASGTGGGEPGTGGGGGGFPGCSIALLSMLAATAAIVYLFISVI